MPAFSKSLYLIITVATVAGCSHSAITTEARDPILPEDWAQSGAAGPVEINWLAHFNDPQLAMLVSEAVSQNYLLAQERARLYQAEQVVTITRASRLPTLDLSLGTSRRGNEDAAGSSVITDSADASIDGRFEVDLWGRLSKEQRAAELALAAQRARLTSVERSLAATTAGAVFNVMEARQLLEVAQRRLANVEESQEIVASGYRQGLNDALDLYLARNQVERQKAALAQQQQTVTESIADLQLALARYPDATLAIEGELPVLTEPVPVGLPSELVTRRTDLQEAWLNVLAADADLAAAHKARFPSLSLVGSTGVVSTEFSELLDNNNPIWSFSAGLTQPLFNAGRLRALEDQAQARVQIAERQYLELLFRAFADVENAISRSASLSDRYAAFLVAEANSRTALELALEQYQRGLVSYTTVLESQRQAFDAETTVVQLKNQLLQNRLALFQSLGGEFATNY